MPLPPSPSPPLCTSSPERKRERSMRLQAAVAPASSVPSKAALLALFGLAAAGIAEGFAPRLLPRVGGVAGRSVLPPLPMAKQGGGGGGGKKRRRRKKKAGAPGGTDGGADNPPVAKIDIGVPQTDTAFPAVAESIPAAPILDVKAELEAAKMLGADIDRLSGKLLLLVSSSCCCCWRCYFWPGLDSCLIFFGALDTLHTFGPHIGFEIR